MNLTTGGQPYLRGIYAPTGDEIAVSGLTVRGEVPLDLNGVFISNGPNPRFAADGRYHWFDGDGMLHAVEFDDGVVSYRNRWVRTAGFVAEEEAGRALWKGVLERPDLRNPLGSFKNTANTDLVCHAGQLLALWWLGGDAYVIRLPDLETAGTWPRVSGRKIAAHPKVDPLSGEMMFLDHAPASKTFTYGVAAKDGSLAHAATIELPGPRLHHDLAVTERFSVLLDMPMMVLDPRDMVRGGAKIRYHRDRPTRLGVIPRHGFADDIRWFEVSPCFIYHTVNAWEEGDRLVVLACRNPPSAIGDGGEFTELVFRPELCRWTLDLVSGTAKEEDLDDVPTEFPTINELVLGSRTRFSYHGRISDSPTMLFDAAVKYDTDNGTSWVHRYPPKWYGGEVVFAPRAVGTDEDDGYALVFVTSRATGQSRLLVLDAKNLPGAPLATVELPCRVPAGFHACWVPAAG